jgi:probable extracellular repeat, HAF family
MVGFAHNPDFSATRAVFWASSSSPAVILSTTGEFTNGGAEGINDKRQIVGSAFNTTFRMHAFLWASPTSQGVDLNTVIHRAQAGNCKSVAALIIAARSAARDCSMEKDHAFALIPVHGGSANALR